MGHIKAYTSLRGIAAWWVVFYHFREALPLSASGFLYGLIELGYISVDFFFVLSGFVIYLNYARLLTTLNAATMIEFLVKRLARVYPLYLVVTLAYLSVPLAYWLTGRTLPGAERFALPYFVAMLTMVQNWGGFDQLAWNIPAWSISTEFAAYLLFPLMVRVLLRFEWRAWGCCIGILVLASVLFAVYAFNGMHDIGEDIPGLGLYRCVAEFAMGVLIGRLHALPGHGSPRSARLATAAIAVLIGLAVANSALPNYAYVPLIFTLLIYLLSTQPSWSQRLFGSNALVYLGEISYSTYLCHFLVKDWVKLLSNQVGLTQFGLYVVTILILSHCLYRWIEVPGRRWGRSLLEAQRNAR
ncbi:MAG TPA: acyltransferase [Roseateles sp.]|nr:acyltransferase [Roseateles sp.]HWT53556.1 acyltransferase [Rhodocyclaceae bacterium]